MFREDRAALLARTDVGGRHLAAELAAATDRWLGQVFLAACGAATYDVSLVAVGGYGRAELAPGSDLDLVLVHRNRPDIGRLADAIWYPVWNTGLRLDHSVRNLREVGATMDTDFRVALGWLDARTVAGSAALGAEARRVATDKWVARARRWLPELDLRIAARHETCGDLAFLLEPDLKASRGGLRDAHLLAALRDLGAALGPYGDAFGPLGDALGNAVGVLTDARVELQRLTARATDRLALQDQEAVAAALGTDSDGLMTQLACAGREVAWASDRAWRQVRSIGRTGCGGRTGWVAEPIEAGLVIRDGEVTLAYGADPAEDLTLPLRAAAACSELGLPMSDRLVTSLTRAAAAPESSWPPELLHALLRLLGSGRAAIPQWETLDRQGVLVGLLPEWAAVRNRPQRNAYHRFTVDRHLLEAAAEAARLARRVSRPDLLLLAALFHDIGKGQGGDHTELGVTLVARIAPRLGLSPDDAATLTSLVRHHLLLAEVATRRDLDDPATITSVAAAVQDRVRLALLAALSEADARATGPTAWTPWKAQLVAALVSRVEDVLSGRPVPPPPPPSPEERRMLRAGSLAIACHGQRLSVVGPDQPDLLAATAGVLASFGASVRAATVRSESPGRVLIALDMIPSAHALPDVDRVEEELAAALAGELDLASRLATRERLRPRPQVAAHDGGEVVVQVDHDSSATATILEVRAPDRPGTLWRVASALARSGLVVSAAIVATLGAEVVDVFYLRTPDGQRPPHDDSRLLVASREVLQALDGTRTFTDW